MKKGYFFIKEDNVMGKWGPDSPVDGLFDYDNDGDLDFFETTLRDDFLNDSDDDSDDDFDDDFDDDSDDFFGGSDD